MDKPCIICNQVKFKGVTKRFRICEDEPAKNLLKAAAFNKDIVHTLVFYTKLRNAADVM